MSSRSSRTRTNIPSVLLLIGLGIGVQYGLRYLNIGVGSVLFQISGSAGHFRAHHDRAGSRIGLKAHP